MSNLSLVLIRAGEENDEAFIYQTWLKGYLFGNPMNRGLDIGTFERNYRPVIGALLKRSTTRVACLKDSPNVILGYSVSEGERLHWLHVKEHMRKFGLAKLLLPKDFSAVSHKTKQAETILRTKFPDIKYNPFL